MLDIGWSEFLIIGVVALVVIGPKELPGALRTAGRFVAKARALAQEFREGLDDIARDTDLKDIQNNIIGDIDKDWGESEAKAQSPIPEKTESEPAAKSDPDGENFDDDISDDDISDENEGELDEADWDEAEADLDDLDELNDEEEDDPGQVAEPVDDADPLPKTEPDPEAKPETADTKTESSVEKKDDRA